MRRESDECIAPSHLFTKRPWGPDWTASEVVRALEPMVNPVRAEKIRNVLTERIQNVTVLLDAPHDPHNGAAILRSCDAFGLTEVHVVPRDEQFLASNVVSKGAERWVDVVEHPTAEKAADALESQGFQLVATHPEGELVPEDLAKLKKVALLFGNERMGLSESLRQRAKQSVRIPMVGFVESLNVSVSAALLVRAATAPRPGDLDAENSETLYAQGLFRTVKRADEILKALKTAAGAPS